jgi:hypothetical protein
MPSFTALLDRVAHQANTRLWSSVRRLRQSSQRSEAGPRAPAVKSEPQSTHESSRGPFRRSALYAATCAAFCSRHLRLASERQRRHRLSTPVRAIRFGRNASRGNHARQPQHQASSDLVLNEADSERSEVWVSAGLFLPEA